jgi:hypothetical protein
MDQLHHRLLDKVSRDVQEDYEHIQATLTGQRSNIQLSGHQAESLWSSLLAAWLPPQYEIGTRKYLLFEQVVDGKSRSGEIDLVVFHPAYPEALRRRAEVMISGVVAAFSVKLTLRRSGLLEAVENAALLRRGLLPRTGELIGDLASPLIVGVFSHSHALRRKDPHKAIHSILQNRSLEKIEHPREELDLVCVADLNCWHRNLTILRAFGPGSFAFTEDQYDVSWKSGDPYGSEPVRPVAVLVSELWKKLANRDASLDPITRGFQATETSGPGFQVGSRQTQPLTPLIRPEAYGSKRGPRIPVD